MASSVKPVNSMAKGTLLYSLCDQKRDAMKITDQKQCYRKYHEAGKWVLWTEFLDEALWGRKGRSTPRVYILQWGQVSAPSKMEEVQCSHFSHFSHSVLTDSLQPHGVQHARLPCSSPTPRDCSNSCPLSQWCQPNISSSVIPFPPAFNPSEHQGLFKWVSSSHQVAKYWSFTFSTTPPTEYSGQISFRIDWFDLLAVQETLKSLLQHHSSKASIGVQLSL